MQSPFYLGEKDVDIKINDILQDDSNILYGLRPSTQSPYNLSTSNELMIHVKKHMEFVKSVEILQTNLIDTTTNFTYFVYVESDEGSDMNEVKI